MDTSVCLLFNPIEHHTQSHVLVSVQVGCFDFGRFHYVLVTVLYRLCCLYRTLPTPDKDQGFCSKTLRLRAHSSLKNIYEQFAPKKHQYELSKTNIFAHIVFK